MGTYLKNNDSVVTQRIFRQHFNIHRNDSVPSGNTVLLMVRSFWETASATKRKPPGREPSLIEWPARSPDLNACNFFLWGYLKRAFTYWMACKITRSQRLQLLPLGISQESLHLLNGLQDHPISTLATSSSGDVSREPSLRTPDNIEEVRQAFVRNSRRSASRNAIALRMSDRTVHWMLNEDLNFHLYKMVIFQAIND